MSKCKSCGAEIIWIKMKSGKAAPCNPQKITYRNILTAPGNGGITLVTPDGRIARGEYDPTSDVFGYESHFATCPAAAAYRKRGKE